MVFNSYCLMVLGKIDNIKIKEILSKISEDEVNFLEAKGLFMATFISILTPSEIKELFHGDSKSTIVFKLSPETASVELTDPEKQELLFSNFFGKVSDDLSKVYGSMIRVDEINDGKIKHLNFIEKIKKMSCNDRKSLVDDIIDKGIKNLTPEDKEILDVVAAMC